MWSEEFIRANRVLKWSVSVGAAASFVAIVQLATRTELNEFHSKAVKAFAAALPILAASAFFLRHEMSLETMRVVIGGMLGFVGMAIFVIGIASLVWSFGNGVMIWFTGGALLVGLGDFICLLARRSSKH
jgi:hypothetical protein